MVFGTIKVLQSIRKEVPLQIKAAMAGDKEFWETMSREKRCARFNKESRDPKTRRRLCLEAEDKERLGRYKEALLDLQKKVKPLWSQLANGRIKDNYKVILQRYQLNRFKNRGQVTRMFSSRDQWKRYRDMVRRRISIYQHESKRWVQKEYEEISEIYRDVCHLSYIVADPMDLNLSKKGAALVAALWMDAEEKTRSIDKNRQLQMKRVLNETCNLRVSNVRN